MTGSARLGRCWGPFQARSGPGCVTSWPDHLLLVRRGLLDWTEEAAIVAGPWGPVHCAHSAFPALSWGHGMSPCSRTSCPTSHQNRALAAQAFVKCHTCFRHPRLRGRLCFSTTRNFVQHIGRQAKFHATHSNGTHSCKVHIQMALTSSGGRTSSHCRSQKITWRYGCPAQARCHSILHTRSPGRAVPRASAAHPYAHAPPADLSPARTPSTGLSPVRAPPAGLSSPRAP